MKKSFHRPYLLFDDTLTQHLVYAIKMAGVILYRLVKHHLLLVYLLFLLLVYNTFNLAHHFHHVCEHNGW